MATSSAFVFLQSCSDTVPASATPHLYTPLVVFVTAEGHNTAEWLITTTAMLEFCTSPVATRALHVQLPEWSVLRELRKRWDWTPSCQLPTSGFF